MKLMCVCVFTLTVVSGFTIVEENSLTSFEDIPPFDTGRYGDDVSLINYEYQINADRILMLYSLCLEKISHG